MKNKTVYVCQECGAEHPRWQGRCSACGAWNTLAEQVMGATSSACARYGAHPPSKPVVLDAVAPSNSERWKTGLTELDRVLGGGLVPASVVLIGGDPGIGKSTLNLQLSAHLAENGRSVLYVSGEESLDQIRRRAQRLGVSGLKNLWLLQENDAGVVSDRIRELGPDCVIIDSIQVMLHPQLASSPGSVAQVRETAALLTQQAKQQGFVCIIIGHVTKEGVLAGPRVLEHLVDVVLYFEGDPTTQYRLLRSIKNRYGPAFELGMFDMTSSGLQEVHDPSAVLLQHRCRDIPGAVVTAVLQGSRPFCVEIQCLVSRSAYGMVRQKAQGFDPTRLAMLIAVMEKRFRLSLADKDVFLNIVGGLRIDDPAADLAVCAALAGAATDRLVPPDTVVFGEVGLGGEVRAVTRSAARLKESQKLGFKQAIVPKSMRAADTDALKGITVIEAGDLNDLLRWMRDHQQTVSSMATHAPTVRGNGGAKR